MLHVPVLLTRAEGFGAAGVRVQLNKTFLNNKRQENSFLKLQILKEWSLAMPEKKSALCDIYQACIRKNMR